MSANEDVPPTPAPGPVDDPWLDIDSIECLCGRCQRGGECRSMRQLRDEDRMAKLRQAQVAALTAEDREWLAEHGWRDTSDDYPSIGTERSFWRLGRHRREDRSALPIDVTPTDPPSQAVMVLGQRVELGASEACQQVAFLVGIWPHGMLEALRGMPTPRSPVPPVAPPGFSPVAVVRFRSSQACADWRDIERIDP